tara:strand:+ start:578 stop:847 length:270 start_codon:yes stop_codon:yes gene_type:complete
MSYEMSQVLFFVGLFLFILASYLKEKKRIESHNKINKRLDKLEIEQNTKILDKIELLKNENKTLREDVNLIARNPQLARRKLKNNNTIL